MDFMKRFLMYETNSRGKYIDYGEVVAIINDKLVNVNVGGATDRYGNKVILEAVTIEGEYVPKIGDWVGIEWRNGMPIAIGGSGGLTTGLTNINNMVKVISSTDIAGNVINADHIRANTIRAEHITAGAIESQHISANSIVSDHISANAILGYHISANIIQSGHISANSINGDHIVAGSIGSDHISANSIQGFHISANSIQGIHISANSIEGIHISANTIQGDHISGNTISGNHIVAGSIDTDKLTVSARKHGLLGQYFTHDGGLNKFQVFKGTRLDESIDFNWGTGSPSLVGQADNFSIRWQGMLFSSQVGQHTFFLNADGGVRLWIDNQLVIDGWTDINSERSGTISLDQSNKWYTVRIDYFEQTSNANLSFKWQQPSGVKEIVPAKYLTSVQTIIDGGTILTNTITSSQIQVGTITAESGIIADAAIQTAHIASGSIVSAHIGDAEIESAHIASGSITTAHIQSGSIVNAHIVELDAGKITTGTLHGDRITAGTIQGSHLSGNTITGDKIAGNTIEGDRLKAGTVTTLQLAAQSITSDKITAGAITGEKIRVSSISSEHIATGGLDANLVTITGINGETLIGGGYLRVRGLDVGVVQSDNLVANGLFLTASSMFGLRRMNPAGETILGTNTDAVGRDQIWKIDLATNTYTGIYVDIDGKKPTDIAIDSDGTYAYVTVEGDDTLVQIDLANNIIGKTLQMGHSPRRIKFTGDTLEDMKHFFVLNTDPKDERIPDTFMVIDAPPTSVGSDLYLHHVVPVGNGPYDLVIDSNKWMYLTQSNQGDIAVFDMTNHDSTTWKPRRAIPIAAFGTDNYHGGLEGRVGFGPITGGDTAGQYDTTADAQSDGDSSGGSHSHGGYGSSDGSLKTYTPKGIEQSSDIDTLYVVDSANNELIVVDKNGHAPYNGLTGSHSGGMESDGSPEDAKNYGVLEGGGPTTPWVRYRIPVGDSPNFVKLHNGKIFVSLDGSGKIAVIDEQDILDEISADKTYYGDFVDYGMFMNWNVMDPMRALPAFTVRTIDVGSKPSYMQASGTNLVVSLTGQNQVVIIDTTTETETARINVGASPMGMAITSDGQYLYVANSGAGGDLSFVYPDSDYIGDPYIGLEGGIEYQGAEYWVPNRSNWIKDASGNIIASSTVEFRVNEPFLNEGGYAKLTAQGKVYQEASIEQDIFNVTNFSNGDNLVQISDERLSINFSANTLYPKPETEWISVEEVRIWENISGNSTSSVLPSENYTVVTGANSRIDLVNYIVPSGNWVTANYVARNDIYFKDHVGSVLIAVENSSTENYNTVFEIDEYIPKFVIYDNQQTEPFTPIADGINEEYTGLEYSAITDRAMDSTITSSSAPTSGMLMDLVDMDHMTGITLPSGLQSVTFELDSVYMVPHIHIHRPMDRTYHETKVEVSEDGTTWLSIFDSAVDGEYMETMDGRMFMFDAKPTKYVRIWSNGYTDGSTEYPENHINEVMIHGDWKVETQYVYPAGSVTAGQQIATNGNNVVTTDVSKAYIAFDIATEFTSWWYMTYLIGPDFGKIAIEMPTLMNSNHFLSCYNANYVNKIAHRHIMSFPPSDNIMADSSRGIKTGKHRAIIRQESGKISLDRVRVEDFQFYARNSLLIPSQEASTTFRSHRLIAKQAKWYEGVGAQSTEGAYDEPRRNPDTGAEDKSVPIKYRFRIKSTLNLDPVVPSAIEERGTTYITSAVMETGNQRSFWRRSESSDSFPASRVEHWDSKMPHKTGIQSHHLANGAVKGPKILAGSIMDYHISPYAKIEEEKLRLNHPTHSHGYYEYILGAGPMGSPLPVFRSNKEFLDSLIGFHGTGGVYGDENTVARGDHTHSELHTHSNKTALDTFMGFSGNGASNYAARADHSHGDLADSAHTHSNKDILDNITGISGTVYNLEQLHTHSNKSILDLFSVGAGNTLQWSGGAIEGGGGGGTGLSGGAVTTEHIRLADGTVSSDTGYGIISGHIRSGAINNTHLSSGIDGAKISGNSIISIPSGKITTGTGSILGGNVSITGDGNLWVGTSANDSTDGDIALRNFSGVNTIHIDGHGDGKYAGVNVYISGGGDIELTGTLTANSITVTDTTLVSNLNAEMIGGKTEKKLAKNQSIYELGGKGVFTGLSVEAQSVPNMTVKVLAGTVYTDTGMRVELAQQNISVSTASTTYTRKDVIYVRGSSSGVNEGTLVIATGTPAAIPVEPTIPSDAVKIAILTIPANTTSIQSSHIADAIEWKPVRYVGSGDFMVLPEARIGRLSTFAGNNGIPTAKPLKAEGWATTFTMPSGSKSYTWTHNLNLSSYVVNISCNSPEPHIYWDNKTVNAIDIMFDDTVEGAVQVDIVITAL